MRVTDSPVVRVPASSANLGAGFDVLGMALDLHLDVGAGASPDGAQPIDRHHPTAKAFAMYGGTEVPDRPLWVRSSIPMGRGLGFSGAARVGGAALSAVCGADDPAASLLDATAAVLDLAAVMEGHGDNAAASALGGVVAWVGGRPMPLRVGPQLAAAVVVTWIPDATTSTDRSRGGLPVDVARAAAVHNLGRVAQFVLAFERDDPSLLMGATDDELHQAPRLAAVPGAAEALASGVAGGAWCGWLSGSGPTVAFLVDASARAAVVAALPGTGQIKQLHIARDGVQVLPTTVG
jgi:homoserine kinase